MTHEILLTYLHNIDRIHKSLKIDNDDKNIDIYSNYSIKIKERYKSFDYSKFDKICNSNEIYLKLIEYFDNYKNNNNGIISVIHGDPVFSNVIVTKDMKFKFIDMRGKLGDVCTIFGDALYDYAKIYQSLIGYDEILLNKDVNINYKTKLIHVFENYIKEKFNTDILNNIKMITNSLLFTLIPLHDNDKCVKYYSLITSNQRSV